MTSLLAFVLAASLLAITPGLDTAMVLRTATLKGPRRAIFAIAWVPGAMLVTVGEPLPLVLRNPAHWNETCHGPFSYMMPAV